SFASLVEARLRKSDFRKAHCHGARFGGAELSYCELSAADLSEADLSGARVDHARFIESDLRRARLRSLRGFEQASFLRADVRDVDFAGAYLLRSHIVDENYLDEFKNKSAINHLVYYVWLISSDCGRSLTRWSLWTLAIAIAFGAAYGAVNVDYGDYATWLSPYYFSLVTLTTLGYGDVLPTDPTSQVLAMAEVSLGYMMLGGLISIFSNKLARRGE
ncbi:MAG: pentapeptide repeat-containing protein, partial [Sandaracinaceae bacterium]